MSNDTKGWRILDPRWDGKSVFSPLEVAEIRAGPSTKRSKRGRSPPSKSGA